MQPDIVVYSADNQEILLVEVKVVTRLQLGQPGWAERIHRTYGRLGRYMLLVTPERVLFWLPDAAPGGLPALKMKSASVFARQLDTHKFPLQRLDGNELESVVFSWLMFSQYKTADELLTDPGQRWLVESGLHAAIFHGDLKRQAA